MIISVVALAVCIGIGRVSVIICVISAHRISIKVRNLVDFLIGGSVVGIVSESLTLNSKQE